MKNFLLSLILLCYPVLVQAQGNKLPASNPYIIVLGTAQDGGYPHAGCAKRGCELAWKDESLRRFVVTLAVVDSVSRQWWLFEATPDIKYQLQYFKKLSGGKYPYLPAGIFITHAHMGHYTGLMQFGREVMNTKELPVYVLPKMAAFLENNGPWSQLVKLKNIIIHKLAPDSAFNVMRGLQITPFLVPHRDEYSETAGFRIQAGSKKYLFIPDIDKWEKWRSPAFAGGKSIIAEVQACDIAFLDATFFDSTELPGRKMSEVPHPLVRETMELFKNESTSTRNKIHFIHFNHSNPLLWDESVQKELLEKGFKLEVQGERY